MKCPRHALTNPDGLDVPPWRNDWRRPWCAGCRAEGRADAAIDRGIASLRGGTPSPEGLQRTLAALDLADPPIRPSRVRVAPFALGLAAVAVVGVMALPWSADRMRKHEYIAGTAHAGDPLKPGGEGVQSGSVSRESGAKHVADGTSSTHSVGAPAFPTQPLVREHSPLPQRGRAGYPLAGGGGEGTPNTQHPTPNAQRPTPNAQRPTPLHTPPRSHTPTLDREHAATLVARAKTPDDRYLNGEQFWIASTPRPRLPEKLLAKLPRLRDDFVQVPYPSVASAASAAVALKAYESEAKIVDPRLFRKITLHLKRASMEDVCAQMEAQTGVRLRVGRGLEDEKATIFVKEQPARDVMRAVARLFGYFWARSGQEGAYRYELTQSLKAQLTEEELRNQDVNAALLALDEEMGVYRGYLGMDLQQLRERSVKARSPEKERLEGLLHDAGWGGMQLYFRLSPAERTALMSGQKLEFGGSTPRNDRQLPAEWRQPILDSYGAPIQLSPDGITVGKGNQRLGEVGSAVPSVHLRLNRSELGQMSLQAGFGATIPLGQGNSVGVGSHASLATGRSPSVARPENAAANAALKKDPFFQRTVSLRPEAIPPANADAPDARWTKPVNVTTAEVWEAVHRETGASIVADSYTRLYPVASVTLEKQSLFDALCTEGDTLGVRWKKDGDFLLARSTSFFWDKLKEVPNRHLARWQKQRQQNGGLPFDDFLEIATLTDAQLDSSRVAEGVRYLWGLDEWGVLAGEENTMREPARFLATLSSAQRQRVQGEQGLAFADLTPSQRQAYLRFLPENWMQRTVSDVRVLQGAKLQASYVPAGWYLWRGGERDTRLPFVTARTGAELAAIVRREAPNVVPENLERTRGDLGFVVELGDGSLTGRTAHSGWARDGSRQRPPE